MKREQRALRHRAERQKRARAVYGEDAEQVAAATRARNSSGSEAGRSDTVGAGQAERTGGEEPGGDEGGRVGRG